MVKANLDFQAVEQEPHVPRWKSREPDPTVQMSVRMHASVYERFRELCKKERRTNGDMLEIMMNTYQTKQR